MKLPFLLSIPHGGTKIPDELRKFSILSDKDLFLDGDAYTIDIYNLKSKVMEIIKTDTARAFVDVSREVFKMPPEFKDGVIKSHTCYNKKIYKNDLPNELIELILNKYYHPYQDKLTELCQDENIILGFDCHSMAEIGPDIAKDAFQSRPLINLGDNEGKSANPEFTKLLKKSFIEVFSFDESEVTINKPFKGGFITRNYGNNPIPFIQIEMNRSLYLNQMWFDFDKLKMHNLSRLKYLNTMFEMVLRRFYDYLKKNNRLKREIRA